MMKTFTLDTIHRIKRYSETLDVPASLCDKSWIVFNDSGEKEVFIFNSDGNVMIMVNGMGVKRTWQWIEASKSLIINLTDDSIIMLHPEYYNQSILVLGRDGTREHAFLFDESYGEDAVPWKISDLNPFFHDLEKNVKAEVKEKEQRAREEQRKPPIVISLEDAIGTQELAEQSLKEKRKETIDKFTPSLKISCALMCVPLFLTFITTKAILHIIPGIPGVLAGILAILMFIGSLYGSIQCLWSLQKIQAKKYIKKHPDDEITPYIIDYFDLD